MQVSLYRTRLKVDYSQVADPAAISPEPTTASKPGKTTPKKRGSASKDEATTPKKKRTPVKVRAEDDDADDDGKETVTPRKRRAPGAPVTPGRPIPANFDAADEADRMLFKMKEDGCGWLEIRTAWTKATGENPGASTLPYGVIHSIDLGVDRSAQTQTNPSLL